MKKLSDKKVLALAGAALYLMAYSAGKKDGIKSMVEKAKNYEQINQSIGYMNAIVDLTNRIAGK